MRQANRAEAEFIQVMDEAGCSLRRRGWPDFWWVNADGRFCVAEVKPTCLRSLRTAQYEVLSHFCRLGALAYTWSPDRGLVEFRPEDWHVYLYNKRYYYWRDVDGTDSGPEDAVRVDEKDVDPRKYERALRGRTDPNKAVNDSTPTKVPAAQRYKEFVCRLIRMVLDRKSRTAKSSDATEIHEMQSIGWALEGLGFPPSRYDEVLNSLNSPRRKKRRPYGFSSWADKRFGPRIGGIEK